MTEIPVLTLRQPWATLVALGVKTIETRSWRTNHRGPLAIHAGAQRPPHCLTLGRWQSLNQADGVTRLYGPPMYDLGPATIEPFGAIVATCNVIDVVPIDHGLTSGTGITWDTDRDRLLSRERTAGSMCWRDVTDQAPYGDFTDGRWAWLLDDVRPLPEPVPFKGGQGLTRRWNPWKDQP